MIDITNKLFQPLTYQLADGTGLHLPPRGCATVSDRQVSAELRRAAQRGLIALESPTGVDTVVNTKPRKTKED